MNKHTSGPWYVEQDGHGPYVCAQRHGRVADVHDPEQRSFKTNGGSEAWANARLIAAAPDLLVALENAMTWLATYGDHRSTQLKDCLASAVKAIAKSKPVTRRRTT